MQSQSPDRFPSRADGVGVTVQVATPDDETAVGDLLAAAYPPLMAPGYDPDVLAAALPAMTKANPALLECGTYYLAMSPKGTVVGCGGWTCDRPGGGALPTGAPASGDPSGHIRHFATHPDWLRQGIARMLFERCTADAVSSGMRRFECFASLVAVAFYARMGFAAVGPMVVPLGPRGFPVTHMVMDLASNRPATPAPRPVGGAG